MQKSELLKIAKPILFNTEMVKAILEDRKKITRRCVKFEGNRNPNWTGYIKDGLTLYNGTNEPCNKPAPVKIGDILYVRETWMDYAGRTMYKADCDKYRIESLKFAGFNWHPSIHMPKEAARIFLKVKDVRVERLQKMRSEDALKEGIKVSEFDLPHAGVVTRFKHLWNSTIKKSDLAQYGWEANPWVWVIEFERIEANAQQ